MLSLWENLRPYFALTASHPSPSSSSVRSSINGWLCSHLRESIVVDYNSWEWEIYDPIPSTTLDVMCTVVKCLRSVLRRGWSWYLSFRIAGNCLIGPYGFEWNLLSGMRLILNKCFQGGYRCAFLIVFFLLFRIIGFVLSIYRLFVFHRSLK